MNKYIIAMAIAAFADGHGPVVGTERIEDATEDGIRSMIILGKNPKASA